MRSTQIAKKYAVPEAKHTRSWGLSPCPPCPPCLSLGVSLKVFRTRCTPPLSHWDDSKNLSSVTNNNKRPHGMVIRRKNDETQMLLNPYEVHKLQKDSKYCQECQK